MFFSRREGTPQSEGRGWVGMSVYREGRACREAADAGVGSYLWRGRKGGLYLVSERSPRS